MNYRVVIEMKSPGIISPYTTLDGPLGWCAVQEAMSKGTLNDYDTVLTALPIEKSFFGDSDYIYRSSSWFLDKGAAYTEFQAFINRRFPLERLSLMVPAHKAKVRLGFGENKNYRIPIYPMFFLKMNFLFSGDDVAVAHLLRKWLRGVGKELNIGYGAVKSIDIGKDDDAPFLFEDGSVRRPIPVDYAPLLGVKRGFELTAIAYYQPPYAPYHLTRQRACLMPSRSMLRGVSN